MSETNYEVEDAKSFWLCEDLHIVLTGEMLYAVGSEHAFEWPFSDIEFIYEQMKELR